MQMKNFVCNLVNSGYLVIPAVVLAGADFKAGIYLGPPAERGPPIALNILLCLDKIIMKLSFYRNIPLILDFFETTWKRALGPKHDVFFLQMIEAKSRENAFSRQTLKTKHFYSRYNFWQLCFSNPEIN